MAMTSKPSPYRRRKPSLLRNVWIYRRLILLAMILGVLLWFMVINNTAVTVVFPFNTATIESTTGLVILISALVGSLATALIMTLIRAIRGYREPRKIDDLDISELPDDRPPPDYASKAEDGFRDF